MNVDGSFSYQGSVQSDRKQTPVPQDLGKFTGSLTAAQSEMEWISKDGAGKEGISQSAELFKEQKSKKELSEERADASMLASMVNQGKVADSQNAKAWSSGQALEQTKHRQMTNQSESFKFQKGMEELQGNRAAQVLDQRIMDKRGHLYNPALAQEPSSEASTYASMTDGKSNQAKQMEEPGGLLGRSYQADPKVDSETAKVRQQFQQFGEVRTNQSKANSALVPNNQGNSATQALTQAAAARATALNATRGMTNKATSAGDQPGLSFAASAKGELDKAGQKAPVAKTEATQQAKLKEVVDNVKMMINSKRNELTMQLNPAHLGKLDIKLTKLEDGYKGKMTVDSLEAKEALERQLPDLQKSLEAQGIKLEEVSMEVREQGAEAFAGAGSESNQQNASERGAQTASTENKARSFEPTMTQPEATPGRASRMSADQVSIYA